MRTLFSLFVLIILSVGVSAQTAQPKTDVSTSVDSKSTAIELAQATLKAHGGEKFRAAKTIVLKGTVEVTAPNSAQTLPAAFALYFSGEKYRFDIQAPPIVSFRQISDGRQTYSSMPGISLPPMNRLGLPLLPRIGDEGFIVSALPEKLQKKRGFRITSPEGFYTDFILDEKTSLVKEYESSYDFNGREITTSVAIDKYREVEGILLNEKFSQRLDMGQFTSYANFKTKEFLVNSEVGEDVFVMPE